MTRTAENGGRSTSEISLKLVNGDSCDLGKVSEHEYVEARFVIENVGAGVVIFDPEIRKGCACTEASLSRVRIRPGEKCTLTMRVKTKASGSESQFVSATVAVANSPLPRNLVFSLSYLCVPIFEVSPSEVNLRGFEGDDLVANLQVRFNRRDNAELKVGATTTAPKSDVTVADLEDDAQHRRGVSVRVRFVCPKSSRTSRFPVVISDLKDPSHSTVASINCTSVPFVTVDPPVVRLTRCRDDEEAVCGVVTLSPSAPEFVIENIQFSTSGEEGINTSASPRSGNSHTVEIVCQKSRSALKIGKLEFTYTCNGILRDGSLTYFFSD